MKLIKQEDTAGSLALRWSPDQVMHRQSRLFSKAESQKKFWTFWPQLRRGMDQLGVKYEDRAHRARELESIKRLAIVGVGGGPRTKDSHWVVYDARARLVYDPWKTCTAPIPALEFTTQIYSYLHVSRA
jgi:hypothetical protein